MYYFSSFSGTLEVVGIPPEVITGPHDRVVLSGDEIILLCEVKAFPLPNFIWYQSSFKNVSKSGFVDRFCSLLCIILIINMK